MIKTFHKLINFTARYYLWIILGGTAAGAFYGYVIGLIDGKIFVEVVVIDGAVGFIASLFAGLIALYVRFRSRSSVNSPPQQSGARVVSADDDKLHQKLEKTIRARNCTLMVMPIVALSTALKYVGIFPTGNLPLWFGLCAFVLCGIQIQIMSHKISKIKAAISGPSP